MIGVFGLASLAMGRMSSLLIPVKVDRIRTVMQRRPRNSAQRDLGEVYTALITYLEKERPYLNPDFRAQDAARFLLTNRNYLSRAIKRFDGGNFCTLVNRYRVRYSIEIFKDNPMLRVSEMASKSGFNSSAAYNMAFKLYTNIPPGVWCQRYKIKIGNELKRKR